MRTRVDNLEYPGTPLLLVNQCLCDMGVGGITALRNFRNDAPAVAAENASTTPATTTTTATTAASTATPAPVVTPTTTPSTASTPAQATTTISTTPSTGPSPVATSSTKGD
eukprot:TRINITY_DN6802_c0_g1_i1.p3 TRINITY_DN6802_c0_g1~~TRINITY_DN6802_c0_g1_i1.p3  ORF type:complete len:111 (+),score=17.75 TRINITY_DN6802_c0_g1_i1:371-703(+)